ncbi:unnamed protein product, partial [marine sediment metagenome]
NITAAAATPSFNERIYPSEKFGLPGRKLVEGSSEGQADLLWCAQRN